MCRHHSGGIATLNHRLFMDDALRATTTLALPGAPTATRFTSLHISTHAVVGASGSSPAPALASRAPSQAPLRLRDTISLKLFSRRENPDLAGRLSAAIPPDCGISPLCFPTGNHQPCAKMIPTETSDFASISGGFASLNSPAKFR